jgi:small subunit ribosomal protein YMR-31
MYATRVLRQAAQHAERTPSIRFLGKRTIPVSVDHTPQPHPASPTHSLPESFKSSHTSFSSYRDHAQQFGPLRKTITTATAGIGGKAGSDLGPVAAPQGAYFDRNELPSRFHRSPLTAAEIEAIETGGAALFA